MPVASRSVERHSFRRHLHAVPVVAGAVGLLLLAGCTGTNTAVGSTAASAGSSAPSGTAAAATNGQFGTEYENTGTGPMVVPTIPTTPSVATYVGQLRCTNGQHPNPQQPAPNGCTRVFALTAVQFTQQIANFPMKTAKVWGYESGTEALHAWAHPHLLCRGAGAGTRNQQTARTDHYPCARSTSAQRRRRCFRDQPTHPDSGGQILRVPGVCARARRHLLLPLPLRRCGAGDAWA